jgi:ABC-type transport system substrate-binding protein
MVAAVEAPDAGRLRFRLKQPWPDFLVYLGTFASSAGWVVPKKYLEQVGEDGFKKAPIGAGPYRFVSFTPGIELVLEAFTGGTFAYGGYADVDGLFGEQAVELDRAKREATLRRMQQLVHERATFAPIYELAFVNGVGPRVQESGLGLIAGHAFSAPCEDVKLMGK